MHAGASDARLLLALAWLHEKTSDVAVTHRRFEAARVSPPAAALANLQFAQIAQRLAETGTVVGFIRRASADAGEDTAMRG